MLKLDITASSRTGCVRTNNEDMVVVGEWFVRSSRLRARYATDQTDRYLIALADGMGGHSGGEIASSDVLHNLQFFFNDIPQGVQPGDFTEMIFEWLQSINNIIDSKGHSDPKYHDMGTTLVALAYYGGFFYWMNCGDSRLYRLHDGKLHQMTTDHSLNSIYGDSQHSNLITNCIGGGCKTSYIDLVECTQEIEPGDILMLCSDGLSDMISDDDICQMLLNGYEADNLCQAADDAGGKDNVSVCVIRVS